MEEEDGWATSDRSSIVGVKERPAKAPGLMPKDYL
jgi:hypothetical protein